MSNWSRELPSCWPEKHIVASFVGANYFHLTCYSGRMWYISRVFLNGPSKSLWKKEMALM